MAKKKNPQESSPALPFVLDKTTWVRNIVPHAYPKGAKAGMEWTAEGGVWDNTDPRDPVCWGAPLPTREDRRTAESLENCIRRLKLEGFLGIYQRVPVQKPQPANPTTTRLTRIAQIAQIAQASAEADTRSKTEPKDPDSADAVPAGQRPTRAQARARARKGTPDTAPVATIVPKKPAVRQRQPAPAASVPQSGLPEQASTAEPPTAQEMLETAIIPEPDTTEPEEDVQPKNPDEVPLAPVSGDSLALGKAMLDRRRKKTDEAPEPAT